MYWNYRIVKVDYMIDGDLEEWYELHEVYYDSGKPTSRTMNALLIGADLDELYKSYLMLAEAFVKEVLDDSEIGNK